MLSPVLVLRGLVRIGTTTRTEPITIGSSKSVQFRHYLITDAVLVLHRLRAGGAIFVDAGS